MLKIHELEREVYVYVCVKIDDNIEALIKKET